ncbi:hypothetical protein [Microterricola viridarii]|uniref:Modulator of FtsH protease n=1 Tax=Microterricola viridarii TaxID=412690 RepID=A0A1H1UM69_9MICO|nr:hypothetical protein [Microterricola viridarii]SDS73565.1 hypothetical protein SAMN04489834_2043 [Microterricola viridarii]
MLAEWSGFFVAAAGACAALGGLIIVAASVSVTEMIAIPGMASRAGVAIALLVASTIIALAALMPGLTAGGFGWLVLLAGGIALGLALESLWRLVRTRQPGAREHRGLGESIAKGSIGVLPSAAFCVAGVLLVLGDAAGAYWIAAGILLAIFSAVVSAWVVLVEIRR